jgi:hypothetical protein
MIITLETLCAQLDSRRRKAPPAYAQRRCIVPVDGFFEWRAIKGARAKHPPSRDLNPHRPVQTTARTLVLDTCFAVLVAPTGHHLAIVDVRIARPFYMENTDQAPLGPRKRVVD